MRSENEILDLIINTAKENPRIRVAYMEGSRTNPNEKKDIFQDYDIVYIVDDTKPFIDDKSWIKRFGEILYMQYPEETPYYPCDTTKSYGWLMQFTDGVRIDLHVSTKDHALGNLELYKTLLDKDNIMPKSEETDDSFRWIQKPTLDEFLATCNEFWWCLNNVAKGLWRKEELYAIDMINEVIRPQLIRLISWNIALNHNFKINLGKSYKKIKNHISEEKYTELLSTYNLYTIENIWNSTFTMCDLFQEYALLLSEKLEYNYDYIESINSRKYLEHVQKLPENAKEI